MDLGDRVRNRRIAARLTQARAAKIAGVSRRHLAALEKGANVSIGVLARVAQVLSISPAELFGSVVTTPGPSTRRYRSAFISYGAPDEPIARRIYEELVAAGVRCFFFPISAIPGTRLHRSLSDSLRAFDRVILLCSANSLNRTGVSYEIEQVFARELEEGASELIIPVALDDAVLGGSSLRRHIVAQLRQRVIADFRIALASEQQWRVQLQRILAALAW